MSAGLNRHIVGAIERKESTPSLDTLQDIASALGLAADVLIRPSEEAHPEILRTLKK